MKKKILCINTYAGSLLIAAKLAKREIVATMEDSGYASELQALNFPKVPNYRTRAEWPDRFAGSPWSEVITIAHPPCAAFSNQNQTKEKRGLETGAFACHTSVMDYALGNGTAALAIESVPGALAAAREVYETYATKHGYSVYFILQNAASFGVPQWRPRFWAWFLKKKNLYVELQHDFKLLGTVVTGEGDLVARRDRQPRVAVQPVLDKLQSDEWRGSLLKVLTQHHGLAASVNYMNARKRHGLEGFFKTSLPRFSGPDEFATTILAESWWYMGDTEITRQDLCAIMGFPRDYQFGKKIDQARRLLSKGICPPVGAWVIEQLERNVTPGTIWKDEHRVHAVKPGEVLDLRPRKADAIKAALQGELL
jgi:site-specific DNA-cytosine methylase